VCDSCFEDIKRIRNGDIERIDYYLNPENLKNATPRGSEYITTQARERLATIDSVEEKRRQYALQAEKEKINEEKERINQDFAKKTEVIVTTGDLKEDYEIIGPVYFQISNKGIFKGALGDLIAKYESDIVKMKRQGTMSQDRADWGFLYGEWSVGQSDFEKAFYVATQELKKRAQILGADAVICMRQDIDLDTDGFSYFYLQMYGTAVLTERGKKLKLESEQ
jgi:hypothetical protein